MSSGLTELRSDDLQGALEQLLVPRLTSVLTSRAYGHCMRIADVDIDLAVRLCRRLRTAAGPVQVHVLDADNSIPQDVAVSSTRLVQLRNPDAAAEQRPPLLVFVPPQTRASVEDSFGVATFEQIEIGDVYDDLVARIREEVPAELRTSVDTMLATLSEENWRFSDPPAQARYLLTLKLNDFDPAAAGAAIFELGLVPDFDLYSAPAEVVTRIRRNLAHTTTLTFSPRSDRLRVLELGLTDPTFRARLADFVSSVGLTNPREWTRRIVRDRANWPLSFNRWPLAADVDREQIRIQVIGLDVPRAGRNPTDLDDPVLQSLAGQQVLALGQRGRNEVSATFKVDPDPRQIAGLTRFSARLIAEDGGRTGVVATVKVSRTQKTEYKVNLKKLRNADLDDGWYFIRVEALDADEIPVPLACDGNGTIPENESERFYIVSEAAVVEPPEQRIHKDASLTHALRHLQFTAAAEGREWEDITAGQIQWKARGTTRDIFLAVFDGEGTSEIPLSAALTDLQRRILTEPDEPARWRLDRAEPTSATREPTEPIDKTSASPAAQTFLDARRRLFAAIRSDDDLVVEACDLHRLRDSVIAYAESYTELLAWELRRAERDVGAFTALSRLLSIDTASVYFIDANRTRNQAILVAPTHPLRLMWLVTWAELGLSWLAKGKAAHPTHVRESRETLLHELWPIGFPIAVPQPDGRLTMAAGNLSPFWGVHLSSGTTNPQGALAELASALGVTNHTGTTLSGRDLADRVERYLRLHPYVHSLTIAAVNPGRGDMLAAMLTDLQRRPGLADITYDLRLFVPDPQASGAGTALADLLIGVSETTSVVGEAFHTPNLGLVPKLSVAVRPLDEFRSASSAHAAHITFLFDAFSGERFNTTVMERAVRIPVHGLVQDMIVRYSSTDDAVGWRKYPRHGDPAPVDDDSDDLTALMGSLPQLISEASAAVTTRQVGNHQVPQTALTLDIADRTLLHQAHVASDWVITIDRTLGVEFFDTPGQVARPEYVIDYTHTRAGGLSHHIVTSSGSLDELRALLTPALTQHGVDIDRRHVGTFFDQLRHLSGRLAFKLASAAPTQRSEVLGLGLARLYLDYQGVLAGQVLVPLDAHLELYRDARRRANELAEAIGLHRTDLALFDLDAKRRVITCSLVEVKCLTTLPELADYQRLKDRIAEQLARSAQILAEHFDPDHTDPDRLDRVVKNAEFASLLGFYLERAVRYGTMQDSSADEARWVLEHLDDGYRLEFTRTGVIFDLSGTGQDTEHDGGIQYHRVGRDLAIELLDAIRTDAAVAGVDRSSQTGTSASLAHLSLTVPRIDDAPFRRPDRDRSVPTDAESEAPEDSGGTAALDPGPRSDHRSDSGHSNDVGVKEPPATLADKPPDDAPNAAPATSATSPATVPEPHIYVGSARPSPQYGVLGESAGRTIALDLNETHTISLFGVQGGGKSYTLGTIMEMASLPAEPVNHLPQPLATIVFHYSPTRDYAPEFTSMIDPNDNPEEVEVLRERYGVEPRSLDDIVMLVPEAQIAQRQAEYRRIRVVPLKFGSAELRAEHLKFLMGAVGNQAVYIRQLQRIMRASRADLSLDAIRRGVDTSGLPEHLKQLAQQRLDLASEYIDDTARIKDLVRPGRVIIVDLRDEFIEKDEALGLFVVLMQLFAEATHDDRRFNKLVVFDEAHKYIDSPDLVAGLVESVREMRHKGMSVLVASQDPPSVPISLIELSDHIILHKFTSPAWLKHIQKANAALAALTPGKMAKLSPGEAFLWSSKATDASLTEDAQRIRCRPRITKHGGATRTAT